MKVGKMCSFNDAIIGIQFQEIERQNIIRHHHYQILNANRDV